MEKDKRKIEGEVREWVSKYYLSKAFRGLAKATDYSNRCMAKNMLIMLGLMIGYVSVVLIGVGIWLVLPCFVVLILTAHFLSKRKRDRYWNQVAPAHTVLENRIEKATQSLPSLNEIEKEKLRGLIELSQNKSISSERFEQELEEALKIEKLRRWSFFRELHQHLVTLGEEENHESI